MAKEVVSWEDLIEKIRLWVKLDITECEMHKWLDKVTSDDLSTRIVIGSLKGSTKCNQEQSAQQHC